MNDRLVSIIVRTKDRPVLLKHALQSILAQTYRPIEVVLVNDGGCDLDAEELQGILQDVSLNYIKREKNKGRVIAANLGIEHAVGKYIGFLDDDDIFFEKHISTLVETLADKDAKIAYTSVQSVYYNWTDNHKKQFSKLNDGHLYNFSFNPSRLLFENYIPLHALLFSADVLKEDKFDEGIQINEDWDLLIRLSRRYRFTHVPVVTAEYRLFPQDGASKNADQIEEDLRNRHAQWLKIVFDKHKGLITGNDWYAFYNGFLIPDHERALKFLKDLLASEQLRLGKNIDALRMDIQQRDRDIQQRDREIQLWKEEVRLRDEEIGRLINSESWKITYPLRQLGRFARYVIRAGSYIAKNKPVTVLRRLVVEFYHSPFVGFWLRFFPPTIKQRVKSWLLARGESHSYQEIPVKNPKVSLVIPVFNHAEYLDECIASAIGQDYENLEIIIVDDCSTEPRVKTILDRYSENPRVKILFNRENVGISETQNRALINSAGDIIAFLDCDDYLTVDAISASLHYWTPSTVYLHTARTNIDKNNKVVQRISFEHLPRKDYFSENLDRMYATHFKMLKRDVFAKVGLFDTRFNSAQDYDMLMRIAFHYPSEAFVFVPKFVYFHRLHEKQDSSKNEERQSQNTSVIQKEACLRKSISEGIFEKNISIIMLSYGKYEQTHDAIESIVNTVKIPFEIILFDNASDGETVNFLKTEIVGKYPPVKVIFHEVNIGPAGGRREALKYAKGPYYIIFDNDEIAQPGWVEELLVVGESNADIAAVVARVFFPDNTLQFSGGAVKYLDEELIELVRYDARVSRYDLSTAQFRDCAWVPIGATLFKVNPSPYLHRGYQNLFEDAGVSFALIKQGYRLVNAPGALVLHNHFMYMDKISMKKKYLEDRYSPIGMLRAIASFYMENKLIIYDEYVWKENGLNRLSRGELKSKLEKVYHEIDNPART